jgi:hypothetical protein
MKAFQDLLPLLLLLAGIGQLLVAALNLALVRILRWERDVAAMPLLVREVFQVHKAFITITLGLFGIWSLAFPDRFLDGSDPFARAVAVGIALFWGIRAVMQWSYYSSAHWRGKARETAAHLTLTFVYFGWASLYGYLAAGGGR